MKTTSGVFGAVWVLVFCLPSVNAVPPAGESTSRLTIELRDGSRVVGQSVDETFKFQSPLLGELKLAVKDIRSVECAVTNAAKLTTAGGDVLTVSFVNSELRISTGFGKVALTVNSIRRLSVSATGHAGRTQDGLVALWSGEGNADDSVGGCNGQLINGVGFTPGKVGQAFDLNNGGNESGFPGVRFNRDSGFLLIPTNPALNVGTGDGFTIVAWIKPATVISEKIIAEYERALGTANGSDVGVQFIIQQVTGTIGWHLCANVVNADDGTGHTFYSLPDLIIPGIWQHVAFSYDKASGAAALYLNGTAVAQANVGSIVPQTSFPYLLFGARTTYGSVANPRSAFSGAMDEIGLYNRALSASEIQALCTEQNHGEPLPPPPARATNY
jgi:hypothetical protein